MILDKLITLTKEEEEMYPSIQAKIWGNIGQVTIPFLTNESVRLLGEVTETFNLISTVITVTYNDIRM